MGVVVVLVTLVLMVLVSDVHCLFAGFDGLPRPDGMPNEPAAELGAKPAVKYEGKPADCLWYGFENPNYDPRDVKNCSTLLWAGMRADPSGLQAFEYFTADVFYDPQADEYLCAIGCFNLAAAPTPAPAAPPATTAPPPATTATPPPTPATPPPVSIPPVVTPAPTPPVVAAPPPATLFRPPPPGAALPPSTAGMPSTAPSTEPSPPATSDASALPCVFFPAFIAVAAAVLGLAI